MTEPRTPEEVPADLAAAFPDVGGADSGAREGLEGLEGLAGLHAALDAEGPVERVAALSSRTRWGAAVGLLLGLVGLVLLTSRRADLSVYPLGRMALDLSLLLVPFGLALSGALRPLSRPMKWGAPRVAAVVVGIVAVVVALSLPVAHALHPASSEGVGDAFVRRASACFGFGLVYAAIATVGMGVLSRGARWLPGTLGVWAAGMVGMVALYFHCPITHPEHLWAGHATVVVPVLLAAWALRRRVDG
jgi:vacuolar-type H+-ATPase subunit I/STV1